MSARGFIRKVAATKPARAVRSLVEDKLGIRLSLKEPDTPKLSVVVVVYNIPREAPRTLLSLSAGYQRDINADQYEVIVVDNGSNPAVDPDMVAGFGSNFRLIRIDPAPPSPAHAVNRGIAEARGSVIGVMIDGARIASPGLIHFALHGAGLYQTPVVAVLGWYLGYDFQRWSMQYGYDQAREDALLAQINWPADGYRLFEIATLDESSSEGWLQPIAESNALFMRRESWDDLGGMDERFDAPGGGLVNLDTYMRALDLPDARLVLLLGEGTFHQLHGGIATNVSIDRITESFRKWDDQFEALRGRRYSFPAPQAGITYLGNLPRSALVHFAHAAVAPIRGASDPPLGAGFDCRVWSHQPTPHAKDPVVAALVELARREFASGRPAATAYIARLARSCAPDEPEPQRLVSLTASALALADPALPTAEFHYAIGEAHRHLGDDETARSNYRKALTLDGNFAPAHAGLATLRMPGDFYYTWLERLYSARSPDTVIEIGVADGRSLAQLRAPALAIGVDPKPTLLYPPRVEAHIFPETSDEFFARRGADALLAGRRLDIGFIDGLHLYEQALKDFINLESYCSPRSMILLHDTVPLDEATQARSCDTQFHTGDVWKTVLALKHYRPDLDIFTVATPWTGLTVVTGLDPVSRVLADSYDEAVARFIDMPFAGVENRLTDALNIVPNDWFAVEERLKARGIL
jgi:glycosyltransferase involved in cell wall biosynthesis